VASATADRSRARAAALAVAALIALVYAGPLLSGERFYFRDVSQNHGPAIEAARAMLRAGQAPWWNPWAGGGEPLFGNPNHVLFVPEGLFGLLLGAGLGLSVAALAGTLVAGLFLFLLLRDLGRSPWAAAGGALAFALSGAVLATGSLPNVMAAVSWIPAALYFLRRAASRALWLPAAVVATGLVFAPCEPASALVLALFALALAGRRALGVLALGLGAAAVQVLPAALWIASSARGASGLAPADATKWSLVLKRLPELVVPGFLGRPDAPLNYWGAGLFDTGLPFLLSLHVGGAVLLLAIFGLRGASNGPGNGRATAGARPETSMAALGAVFLLLAIVATPARLGGIVPGAGLFRYPEKFVLGTFLAIALLAASGIERLIATVTASPRTPRPERGLGERGAFTAAASGITLVLLALAVFSGWIGSWFSLYQRPFVVNQVLGIRAALGLAILELAVFVGAVLLARRVHPDSAGPLLVCALAAGLLAGGLLPGRGPLPWRLRANPSVPASFYATQPFFADRLKAVSAAGERVFRFDRPARFAVLNRTGTLADGHQWDRRSLGRSSASEFGVPLAYDRSTDRLDPAGQDAALGFLTSGSAETQARFWSLSSVRLVYAYEPLDAPGLRLVDKVEGESNVPLLLYENARCLPRARMTSNLRSYPVDSDEQARARIASASADDWQEPQIQNYQGIHIAPEQLARSHAGALPKVASGRDAAVVESRPGFLRIRVGASPDVPAAQAGALRRPENLLIAENDVPGWTATLDGRTVPISRANGMHVSLLVPDTAPHEVVLAYSPPGLLAGAAISALALMLALVRGLREPRLSAARP